MMTPPSVALRLVNGAAKTAKRFEAPTGPEALHDFRVALRRLDSHLKAYRRSLKTAVSGKDRKRLGRLLSKTNPIRDAEVQLAWVKGKMEKAGPPLLAGLESLEAQLSLRLRKAREKACGRTLRRFWKLENVLRRNLRRVRTSPDDPFEELAAAVIAKRARKLGEILAKMSDHSDPRRTHKLRIAAKTLRYVLEAFKDRLGPSASILERLKAVQGILGELHDRTVFLEEAGGLSAVKTLLERECEGLAKDFAAWLARDRFTLAKDIGRFARTLSSADKPAD